MMKARFVGVGAIGALALLALFATSPRAARSQAPTIDPQAVGLLKKMTEHLSGLEKFSVDSQTTFEDLLDSGHRVDYEISGTTTVRRPNKLRTERHGDHLNQVFYYDGTSLTLDDPVARVYAREPAPGTIEAMFQVVYDTLGIGTPVSDLVHRDAFPLLMQDVTLAARIGKEVIRGADCQHLLFSRPGVDFQVWVASDGPPWPLKYVVTDTSTPALLSVSTFMSAWNAAPAAPDSLFQFVPPAGTSEIPFVEADTTWTSSR